MRLGGDKQRAAPAACRARLATRSAPWETKMVGGCDKAFSAVLHWVTSWLLMLADWSLQARTAETSGCSKLARDLVWGLIYGNRGDTCDFRSFGMPRLAAVAVRAQPSAALLRQPDSGQRSFRPPQF